MRLPKRRKRGYIVVDEDTGSGRCRKPAFSHYKLSRRPAVPGAAQAPELLARVLCLAQPPGFGFGGCSPFYRLGQLARRSGHARPRPARTAPRRKAAATADRIRLMLDACPPTMLGHRAWR
jgi:hypothetical protein